MSHKVSSCEVIVVGGGVIGAACARAAAARGLRVVLLEPGPDPAAASPASAGMLAAQIEPTDDWLRAIAVRARDLYETLAPALHDATGIDIGFWRPGIASVAFDDSAAERLRQAVAAQRQAGLRCDWLEPEDVAERFPGMSPPTDCRGALFAPEDGAVDPAALTRALLADAQRLGATIVPAPAQRITATRGRVTGVATGGREGAVHAERVVLAAGAWTPRIGGLPRPLAVEPVRGQMAAVPWPQGVPPVIAFHDHTYVVARGSEALLGSTMERAGFDARVTDAGLAQIRRGAERLLPALKSASFARTWAGLRPVTPDGCPIMGPDAELPGLWYATGHGRNGMLLAALTGDIIGALLAGEATDVDLAPFSPSRAVSPQPSADG